MTKIIITTILFLGANTYPINICSADPAIPARNSFDRFKKLMQAPPPDILNKTLNEARQQDLSSDNSDSASTVQNNRTGAEPEFKNPFLPQIPQPKTTSEFIEKPVNPLPVDNSVPSIPTPQFTVSGLVWNTKKPEAIVNGQIVFVGDQVSNWQVAEISKDGVRVINADQNLWIKPVVDPGKNSPAPADSTLRTPRQIPQIRGLNNMNPYQRR